MITAGLKLTRSGGIALVRDGRLESNVEVQQLDNNPRHAEVADLATVPALLASQGHEVGEIDEWVIDGWHGAKVGRVLVRDGGAPREVIVAPFRETEWLPESGQPGHQGTIELAGRVLSYASYSHVASHLAAAYCTSPFAVRREPASVLVWDTDSFPLLYYVDEAGRIEAGGEVAPLLGSVMGLAARDAGPERSAGGTPTEELTAIARELYERHFESDQPAAEEFRRTIIGCGASAEPSHRYVRDYLHTLRARASQLGAGDADVVANLRGLAGTLLVERVTSRLRAWRGDGPFNLCVAGESALDPTWITALHAHPLVRAIWVPPFADESGCALGAAALHLGRRDGLRPLPWRLRSGPELVRHPHQPAGWSVAPCRPEELARLLYRSGKPVVVLSGRAPVGSRTIDGRCVLAPAVAPATRDLLHRIMGHETDPPGVVAACLTEHAPEVFDPGTPDPYRTFAHRVRPEWTDRIPAVSQGGARLQTVEAERDPALATILREYTKWSGVPVLCGISAGRPGHGPFPDARSAMRWGEVELVWSDGVLHRRVRDGDQNDGS